MSFDHLEVRIHLILSVDPVANNHSLKGLEAWHIARLINFSFMINPLDYLNLGFGGFETSNGVVFRLLQGNLDLCYHQIIGVVLLLS